MSKKSKIEPVEKVKIVERYLAREIGIWQTGKELGVDHHSIRNWISIYQYDGQDQLDYSINPKTDLIQKI